MIAESESGKNCKSSHKLGSHVWFLISIVSILSEILQWGLWWVDFLTVDQQMLLENLRRFEIYRQYIGADCTRSVSLGSCFFRRLWPLVCECLDGGMGARASWDMWGKLQLMEEHTKEVHFQPALQSLCLDVSPKSFLHPQYLKLSDVSNFQTPFDASPSEAW